MNRISLGNYVAEIEIDLVDEMLCGRIINIPDLIRFTGSSVSEIKSAFARAIVNYEQEHHKKEISEPPAIEDIEIDKTNTLSGIPVKDRFHIYFMWFLIVQEIELDRINKVVAIERIAAALRSDAGIDPTFRAYVADMMLPIMESDLMPKWRFAKVTARRRGKPITSVNIEQALAVRYKYKSGNKGKNKKSKETVYLDLGEFDDSNPHIFERMGVTRDSSVDRKTFMTSEVALKRIQAVIDRYRSNIISDAEMESLAMVNWENADDDRAGGA